MREVYRSGETMYCLYEPVLVSPQSPTPIPSSYPPKSALKASSLTIRMQPRHNSISTIRLPTPSTALTLMANVRNRLEARSHPNPQTLNALANLHNDARALVARAPRPVLGHLRHSPVVQHEVHVT